MALMEKAKNGASQLQINYILYFTLFALLLIILAAWIHASTIVQNKVSFWSHLNKGVSHTKASTSHLNHIRSDLDTKYLPEVTVTELALASKQTLLRMAIRKQR